MAMIKTDSRSSFYLQQPDEGSQLSPEYNQAVLSELLLEVPKDGVKRIGDLGSGAGSNIYTLYRHFANAQIVTLDLNWSALTKGRQLQGKVAPAQSDAAAIPLASGSLGLMVCTEVLEHVAQMEAVFCEISRVLRPGAFAVISSPNYLNPMGIRKWINDQKLGDSYWDPWGGHPGFERLMFPASMRKALNPYFDIVKVLGAGYVMGWIPLGYRRIGRTNDLYPLRWIGRLPLLRNLAMNRYLLIRRKTT
jgi:SAM-dependent methyltransferase